MKHYQLTGEQIQFILDYLVKQPYAEVYQHINMLMQLTPMEVENHDNISK